MRNGDRTTRLFARMLRGVLRGWIGTAVLVAGSAAAQESAAVPASELALAELPSAPVAQPPQDMVGQQASVSGRVSDPAGAMLAGVHIRVTLQPSTLPSATPLVVRETRTDSDGSFSITDLPPGSFVLRLEIAGFASKEVQGLLRADEAYRMPDVNLPLAGTSTDVQVSFTSHEIAQQQIEAQEKQRVFGAIPNFYVSYDANPQPLSAGQKYHLALRTLVDPASFVITGIIAGVQQANNTYSGFGQGTEGYAKRYGAGYADFASGVLIGNAILPALLKQDPRYFYQGTGTKRSRALHAIARSVICRSDSGHNQFDYSGILGGLASSGLSNAYHPAKDRNGAGLTFENLGIGIAGSAAGNLFQEFLVRRLSTGAHQPSQQVGP